MLQRMLLLLLLGSSIPAGAQLVVDGESLEWKGVPAVATDAAGDPVAGAPASCDIVGVAVARDGERLVVGVRFAAEPVPDDGIVYALDVSTDGHRFDYRICGTPPVVFHFAEGTVETAEVELPGVESAVGEVAEFAVPLALFPGGLPERVALKAIVIAPPGAVADECEFLWEPSPPARTATLAEDPAGDSTGPEGSDLVRVEVARVGRSLRIAARLAGEQPPATGGIAWSVASARTGFYNRSVLVWTDERGAARSALFRWVALEAPPEQLPCEGISVSLIADGLEVRIPLELLAIEGANDSLWVRVASIDPVSGKAFDEVDVRCDSAPSHD